MGKRWIFFLMLMGAMGIGSTPVFAQVIQSLPTSEPVVALTFDDGPDPIYTPQILAILNERGIRATFFLVGSRVNRYPELVRRAVAQGHTLGNHSLSHINYAWLGRNNLLQDIRDSQLAFSQTVGFFPVYFRPPFGGYKPTQLPILTHYYKQIVLWSTDGLDYESGETPESVVSHVSEGLKPGAIFLFHDSNATIVAALPKIIDLISEKGYRCVSLGEFFGESHY